MRIKSAVIIFVTLLTLAATVSPARAATITTYSTLAAWQAVTSGVQTDNLEGYATPGGYTTYASGFTQNGVQFVGLSGATIGVMDTSAFSWANYGTVDAGFSIGGTQAIRVILPANVTAFAINLFTSPPAVSDTASLQGNQYTVPTYNQPTVAFFGVTSDTAIPYVDITAQPGATYAFFDNVQFGTSTAQVGGGGGGGGDVPEAGTCLLIGSGLLGLTVFRRNKKTQV